MLEKARTQYSLAWGSYFLLGTGLLAPWNALLTGIDYFSSVFPGKPMDRLFTITYLPACLLVLLLLLLRFSRINSPFFTPYGRIVGSFIGFALIMLLIPVLDLFGVGPSPPEPTSSTTSPFFPAVLVATVVIGVLDGLCQGAVFADVAALPTHYTQAVVSGTACSGFLVSLLRIISKALWTEEQQQTGFLGLRASTELYFVAAAALSLACAAAYGLLLPSLKHVQMMRRQSGEHMLQVGAKEGQVLPSLKAPHNIEAGASGSEGAWTKPPDEETGASSHGSEQALLLSLKAQGERNGLIAEAQGPVPMQTDTLTTFRACWGRLWRLCAGLLLTYTFTLSIFPGFLAEDTKDNDLGDWYPILLLFAFNASDFIGKLLPGSGNTWKKAQARAAMENGDARAYLQHVARWWLIAAAARFLFIPAFLAAAFLHIHPLLMGTLTVALGASNGYVTAGLMLGGPELLEAELQEAGEGLLVLSLITGLLIGALCGFLWLLI